MSLRGRRSPAGGLANAGSDPSARAHPRDRCSTGDHLLSGVHECLYRIAYLPFSVALRYSRRVYLTGIYLAFLVVAAALAFATSHLFTALTEKFSGMSRKGLFYKNRDIIAALLLFVS